MTQLVAKIYFIKTTGEVPGSPGNPLGFEGTLRSEVYTGTIIWQNLNLLKLILSNNILMKYQDGPEGFGPLPLVSQRRHFPLS